MSDLQGPRIPGEERSGRRRPIVWILLGLILLALLALLVPFACQALRGTGDQGSTGGSGAQGGAKKQQEGQNKKSNDGQNATSGGKAGGQTGGEAGGEAAGSDRERDGSTRGDAGGQSAQGSGATSGGTGDVLVDATNKTGDGTAVTVPKVRLDGTTGWLAVRAEDGGKPGAVLGHAALKEGTSTGVRVNLDRPVDSSRKLYAVVHTEDPADGKFTFPDGDPPVVRDGKVAADPLYYTVRNAAGGASGEQAGTRDGALPASGGIPPVTLLAAAVALLSLSAGSLSSALRQGGTNRH